MRPNVPAAILVAAAILAIATIGRLRRDDGSPGKDGTKTPKANNTAPTQTFQRKNVMKLNRKCLIVESGVKNDL